jgi:hypothetical protein
LQAGNRQGNLAQRTAVTGVIKKPRPRPDYRLETLDDEILLYHPAQTKVLYLNETASLIWKLCDGTRSPEEITELLQDAFPEQASTMRDEVEATLRSFVEHGAIELV